MAFQHKTKLPLRGTKKLPLRGPRSRRMKLLRQFDVGRVYSFDQFWDLPPADWFDASLMEIKNDDFRNC